MKTNVIVAVASSAVGLLVGTQLPRDVVTEPVSITTFKISVPFDQWAEAFDSKETGKMHKINNIKPLFRGVSIDNRDQVVVIHQSQPGVVKKLLSDNAEMIESLGHIMRTTKTSNWSFQ